MAEFITRYAADGDFALENLSGHGDSDRKVFDRIASRCRAELLTRRFTYSVVKICAKTPGECEKIIRSSFDEVFPGQSGRLRFITVPFSQDDAGTMIKDLVSNFFGVESYQKTAAELYSSLPVLKKNGSLGALRLQNYLFAIDPGNGFSTLVSSFGDFLCRAGVYDNDGTPRNKYCEFKLGKESENGMTSTDDFIGKLDEGFADDCGAVGLDVSFFLGEGKEAALRDLVGRLHRFQDRAVFIFRVPFLEKKSVETIADILGDVALTRVVEIPPLHDSVLVDTLWERLYGFGITPDESVVEPFLARVAKEKTDGRFYGFRTVEKIAGEMVLYKAKIDSEAAARGEKTDARVMTDRDLSPGFALVKKEKSGYDELGELIGMEKIAARVREIVAQVKLSMMNEKLDRPCIHMRFIGHPGTGKTTVARIIGRIFREEGILRKGGFFEYSARSLCAEYVGQTAVKTAAICRDAYGSVLFIDEAYALYDNEESKTDYGREVLTTLISEMENHRDDMLVIMAGYTEEMETLMKGNAGLRSRMPYVIEFPNYTREQLYEIFMMMSRKSFSCAEGYAEEAKRFFDGLSSDYVESKEFANARFVRNLFERTWSKCALRASLSDSGTLELTAADFRAASSESEFSEKLMRKKSKIGFVGE